MVCLFPAVHRLLIVLAALQHQHVNRAWVCHMAVLVESLADPVSYIGRRDAQCIQSTNFGGLCEDDRVNRKGSIELIVVLEQR